MRSVTFLPDTGPQDEISPADSAPQSRPAHTNTPADATSPTELVLDARLTPSGRHPASAPADVAEDDEDDSSSESLLGQQIPYVSSPRVLRGHLVIRIGLTVVAAVSVVCCALALALPLAQLRGGATTYAYTVRANPSMWLASLDLSSTSNSQAATEDDATARSIRATLSLMQVGVVGGLVTSALCVVAACLFAAHRWLMEQSRRADDEEAHRTTHRLSEVFFTRREISRRRVDLAFGWALAVTVIAFFIFDVVAVVGLIKCTVSEDSVWDTSSSILTLVCTSVAAAVAVALILSVLLIILVFTTTLSDFHPCGATVMPVRFPESQTLNMQETDQSRALREQVRRERESARLAREEAARHANTVRGLTLEQSMPPSPWSFSLHSYAARSLAPSARDAPEGSIYWCATSTNGRRESLQSRHLHRNSAEQESSFLASTSKLDPHQWRARAAEDGAESAAHDAAAAGEDQWLVGVDEADPTSPWSAVQNPLLPPVLRQYVRDTAQAAQREFDRSTTSATSAASSVPRTRALGAAPNTNGAARFRGLSADNLSTSTSAAPSRAGNNNNNNSSSGGGEGTVPMTTFSVGWNKRVVGTSESVPHGEDGGASSRGRVERDGETFREYLCVADVPPTLGQSYQRATHLFTGVPSTPSISHPSEEDDSDAPPHAGSHARSGELLPHASVSPMSETCGDDHPPSSRPHSAPQLSPSPPPPRDAVQTTAAFRNIAANARNRTAAEKSDRARSSGDRPASALARVVDHDEGEAEDTEMRAMDAQHRLSMPVVSPEPQGQDGAAADESEVLPRSSSSPPGSVSASPPRSRRRTLTPTQP